ncbi:1,4-alpha-glucan branching enzyme [Syntrophobacter sp. SbD1]|nr:1,4-alpha-glucan branching enzyme [Syntrophobacter sp. SbD1]
MNVADATPAVDAVAPAEDFDTRLGDISISTRDAPESAGAPNRTRSEPAGPEASLTAPASTVHVFQVVFESTAAPEAVAAIAGGFHSTPFDILGLHNVTLAGEPGLVVRTFQPQARSVSVLRFGQEHGMQCIHADGVFETVFSGVTEIFPYTLSVTLNDGRTYVTEDPFRFPPVLTEYDLHLFSEGNHFRLYDKLGAHIIEHCTVRGVHFSVWAPGAERVSVVGAFNQWDGRRHPMNPRGMSGLWEIFIPGLAQGDLYKYEIKTRYEGYIAVKADPFGFSAEMRPNTASVVWDLDRYEWADTEWMHARKERQKFEAPISIYEVHLGSWRKAPHKDLGHRWLTYRELAEELVPYAKEMGYTHLQLLPVTEHPFDGSWGYQTVGYFAPTSRHGTPDDFRHFVDTAHQAGLGVIMDWVPAHFPKDGYGLSFFDGTHLYEHADPRQGEHQDWDTLIYNYGRNEVRAFLLSNALFWLDEYHIDGIRVDAVASMLYLDYSREPGQWIPNQYGGRENLEAMAFIKQFNELVHQEFPDVLTFAEESTDWPMVSRPTYAGGLGFDLKWNMGWMHDMLEYMQTEPVHRKYHHHHLTFSLLYAFTENFTLPFSHDEVVHGKGAMLSKMPGDYWQKFANLRALYAYMYGHPGKKLLFMGCEFGQWNEWNHDQELDWMLLDFEFHRNLQQYVRDLNRLYISEPALHEMDFSWEGFQWIDLNDIDQSIVSFIRRARDPNDFVIVASNFTPVVRHGYHVGVPAPGVYRELLNSDSSCYSGGNAINLDPMTSEPGACQGQPHSIVLTLPPLGVVFLKLEKETHCD